MTQPITLLEQTALKRLSGGLKPPDNKACSTQSVIQRLPLAPELVIPLQQHAGPPGQLIVQVGQHVRKGTPLTQGFDRYTLPVHAPTSGEIRAIGRYQAPLQISATRLPSLYIKLQSDGDDRWQALSPLPHYREQPASTLITHLTAAGIAGLGGAGFPSSAKWSSTPQPLPLLIINALECEPYLTADDCLIREQAQEIIQGCYILQHILAPQRCVIAIEDNKPQALAALQQAFPPWKLPDSWLQFRILPTRYPSGDARQLIWMLTGREVPQGQHSNQIGIVVHNVATVFAIQQAIIAGKPLIERVVTLTGEALQRPGNFWVPLGTPVAHLLQLLGIPDLAAVTVTVGGPLMGQTLTDYQAPVIKTTNCLLVRPPLEPTEITAEQPCIRCGDCVTVCPVGLLPQQLYWFSRGQQHEAARAHHLFSCIECGACSAVCPSHIPLVQYYQQEKAQLRIREQQAQHTEQAKTRFEAKQRRLAEQQQARQQPRAAPVKITRHDKAVLAPSSGASDTPLIPPELPITSQAVSGAGDRQAAVAEAISRAKARKAEAATLSPPFVSRLPRDV
jgi:Na+-translocating ferredoxin:NAD+ oxidoreductase subunit C